MNLIEREETCPMCEGREMRSGEGCIAGCRDGKVLWTSANVLRNVKYWMDADRRSIERLTAQVEVMREALEKIDKWCCPVFCTNCARNRDDARAALSYRGAEHDQ